MMVCRPIQEKLIAKGGKLVTIQVFYCHYETMVDEVVLCLNLNWILRNIKRLLAHSLSLD